MTDQAQLPTVGDGKGQLLGAKRFRKKETSPLTKQKKAKNLIKINFFKKFRLHLFCFTRGYRFYAPYALKMAPQLAVKSFPMGAMLGASA